MQKLSGYMRYIIATTFIPFLLLAWTAPVYASESLEFGGRLRSIASINDNSQIGQGTEFASLNSARFTFDGKPEDWLKFELHLIQTISLTTDDSPLGSIGLGGSSQFESRYRAFDMNWDYYDRNILSSSASIDRLNFTFRLPDADFTIGRQAITFGKAYFWNPLDLFMPFNAQQVERDYKGGVDAIRVDIPLGDFSGMNIIAAAGRELEVDATFKKGKKSFDADWYSSALIARMFDNWSGWDVAFQGGKVYGGYQLGGGLVGEVGKYQIRGEGAYFFAEDSPPMPEPFAGDLLYSNFVASAGFGRLFTDKFDLEVEYLYNGAGDPGNPEASVLRILNGASMHIGRHLFGAVATIDFDPLITGQFILVRSFYDASTLIQPVITYSVDDNSDLQIGAAIGFGEPPKLALTEGNIIRSEFGTYPDYYFVDYRTYF